MLGNEPVLSPDERFYERLLSNDPEDAAEQAELALKEQSLTEFFDSTVLPALAMAQADSDRGVLPPERRAELRDSIRIFLEHLSDPEQSEPEGIVYDTAIVACIAGRNELDEAAAMLLSELLRRDRISVRLIPAEAVASPGAHDTTLGLATIVFVSLISTVSPIRARYILRRLRRFASDPCFMVGFWKLPTEPEPAQSPAELPAELVVASLGAAVSAIRKTLRQTRPTAAEKMPGRIGQEAPVQG